MTQLAVLYVESFGNPRKFAGTARRVAQRMPVLTVIGARSPAGHRAASHTAAAPTPLASQEAMFNLGGSRRWVSSRDRVSAGKRPNHSAAAVSSWPGKNQRTSRLRTPAVTGLSHALAVIVPPRCGPAGAAGPLCCRGRADRAAGADDAAGHGPPATAVTAIVRAGCCRRPDGKPVVVTVSGSPGCSGPGSSLPRARVDRSTRNGWGNPPRSAIIYAGDEAWKGDRGHLCDHRSRCWGPCVRVAFDDVELSVVGGTTVLRRAGTDQAALHGLLRPPRRTQAL